MTRTVPGSAPATPGPFAWTLDRTIAAGSAAGTILTAVVAIAAISKTTKASREAVAVANAANENGRKSGEESLATLREANRNAKESGDKAYEAAKEANAVAREANGRTLRLAEEQLDLAKQERTATLRGTLFEARLGFFRDRSIAMNRLGELMHAHRATCDKGKTSVSLPSARRETRMALLEAGQREQDLTQYAIALMPEDYLVAHSAVLRLVFAMQSCETHEEAERIYSEFSDVRKEIGLVARKLFGAPVLDAQLWEAIGGDGAMGQPAP